MSDFLTSESPAETKLLPVISRLDCIECGTVWSDPSQRWRLYATNDEPAQRELGLFCPECASREFDG